MPLDVSTPDPPDLDPAAAVDDYDDAEVAGDADLRKEELQAFLEAGAWAGAFEEWAAETGLSADAYAIVADLELLARFDFFWDDFAGRVGFHAPGLPEDWREREVHPDLDSWATVSSVNASLTELGRTVANRLEADYVDWDADYEAPDDLPEF
jgi:hypothetical protein